VLYDKEACAKDEYKQKARYGRHPGVRVANGATPWQGAHACALPRCLTGAALTEVP
jgi:hypothetical protein